MLGTHIHWNVTRTQEPGFPVCRENPIVPAIVAVFPAWHPPRMVTVLGILWSALRAGFRSRRDLVLENVALQQQLSIYKRTSKRPRLRPSERVFWVGLSRIWGHWRSPLIVVKPDTVNGWHRQGFRLVWRWRSRNRNSGRPRIPHRDVELIGRISRENPAWGEDRIALELKLKLGVEHSTSTIRRYMVRPRNPKRGQTWMQFITNHGTEIYACDLLTQ